MQDSFLKSSITLVMCIFIVKMPSVEKLKIIEPDVVEGKKFM